MNGESELHCSFFLMRSRIAVKIVCFQGFVLCGIIKKKFLHHQSYFNSNLNVDTLTKFFIVHSVIQQRFNAGKDALSRHEKQSDSYMTMQNTNLQFK